ncbi:MAG: SOS response-associated peptidase family protein [Kiritimatiellae bacterium]|nr:SOS response-associated peptidase family protein [Kiritimatiellia bacterium]
MCTRFHIAPGNEAVRDLAPAAQASPLAARFASAGRPLLLAGDVRPTDVVPVLAPGRDGAPRPFPMQWGFRLPDGPLLVNARSETAAVKPAFRDSWLRRRCAIPATCYYEWEHRPGPSGRTVPGTKYAIRHPDAPVLWLCALYRMEAGLPVFAVLTRPAPAPLSDLHPRMPLILPADAIPRWLAPAADPAPLLPLALSSLAATPSP